MKKLIRCLSRKLYKGDIAYSFTFGSEIEVDSINEYISTIPEYSRRDVLFYIGKRFHIQRDNYFYKKRWESFKKHWRSFVNGIR